jgi:hypothetical protein
MPGYWIPQREGYVYVGPRFVWEGDRFIYHRPYWEGPHGYVEYRYGAWRGAPPAGWRARPRYEPRAWRVDAGHSTAWRRLPGAPPGAFHAREHREVDAHREAERRATEHRAEVAHHEAEHREAEHHAAAVEHREVEHREAEHRDVEHREAEHRVAAPPARAAAPPARVAPSHARPVRASPAFEERRK